MGDRSQLSSLASARSATLPGPESLRLLTMESKFGLMTIPELKAELKKRNAKQAGMKKDLVERLEAYERNKNFGQSDVTEPDYHITPSLRTLNVDSKLCNITSLQIHEYISKFDKDFDHNSVKQFYDERFLKYIRVSLDADVFYIRSACHAEMRRGVTYSVDILINREGNIEESQCECAAGMGPNAHCKHVCTVLYAALMFSTKKIIKTEQTCTQKLQQFHQCRTLLGSPIKSSDLELPGSDEFTSIDFDPRPQHLRNATGYQDLFRNTWLNFPGVSKLPIFQLFSSANNFAVAHDHGYCRLTPEDIFLESSCITKISPQEINAIWTGYKSTMA